MPQFLNVWLEMGRWFQISPLLEPRFGLRTCSHATHSDIIETLRDVADKDNMPLCKYVAELGYDYNDIFLNRLSDLQLVKVIRRLPKNSDCSMIADEISIVLQARSIFRQSLHPRMLLIGLLRNQLKSLLEDRLEGNFWIGGILRDAASNGYKEEIEPIIREYFTDFFSERDRPDYRLILKGCIDVDRII